MDDKASKLKANISGTKSCIVIVKLDFQKERLQFYVRILFIKKSNYIKI